MVPTGVPNGASSLTRGNLERQNTNHKAKGVRTSGINGNPGTIGRSITQVLYKKDCVEN